MFRSLLARLSAAPRTPIRTRLRVEPLEGREVPALLTWTGLAVTNGLAPDTDFYLPDNWSPAQVPQAGDDLVFQWASPNPKSNKDCTNMGLVQGSVGGSGGGPPTASSGHVNSLKLLGGYSGTVTLSAEQEFDTFELKSPGVVAQPTVLVPTDITVTNKFTWTKGTLNNSGYDARLIVEGGTADISPENEGTVTTGSTIVLAVAYTLAGTVGATATWNPGTVNFVGGNGVLVEEFCSLDLPKSGVTWNTPAGNVPQQRLDVKGTCTVRNVTEQANSMDVLDMPLVIAGGRLSVSPTAGVTFKKEHVEHVFGVPIPMGSVWMSSGKIVLWNTATLKADKGVLVTGGSLEAWISQAAPNTQADRSANIDGLLSVSGGTVTVAYQNVVMSGVRGYLSVTKDVTWSGGVFTAGIDNTANEVRSEWRTDGKFTIDSSAKVNVTLLDATVVPPAGRKWSILYGAGGITGIPLLGGVNLNDYTITANPFVPEFVYVQKL